jgi:cytochrome c1
VHAYAWAAPPPSTSDAIALSDDERSARGYQQLVRECTAHDQWARFAAALTQLVAADDAAAAAADPATLASDGYQRCARGCGGDN